MKEVKYCRIKGIINKKTKGENTNLLLGNGFGISYDTKIFSYKALSDKIRDANSFAASLLKRLEIENIELIMRHLNSFKNLSDLFSTDKELPNNIENAINELKTTLITTLKDLHPSSLYEIEEDQRESCMKFLDHFSENNGCIFTTNYDLLLYWTLMSCSKIAKDGFGKNPRNKDQLIWGINSNTQNIYYLHGALHLFDEGVDIVKVKGDDNHSLLKKIIDKINSDEYPVFVSAGTSTEKLKQILHNQYLADCYNQLKNIKGTLFTYGFNFGENDIHIIDAINIASNNGLDNIYIGYFSDDDKNHFKSIRERFDCKNIRLYDVKDVNLWNNL